MRCYEFYCAVYTSPDICRGKSDRQLRYIYEYIDFMREKGVKFDKTPEDKELFEGLQKSEGSERVITQPESLQHVAKISSETPIECTSGACGQTELPHVVHNSGEMEWYTPKEYIDAAREVMNSIMVDPASTEKANTIVQADIFYTKDDDGLTKDWTGTVWMNPPYAQPLVAQFCDKFIERYRVGAIRQGCVLLNNATETVFFQSMLEYASAICFIKGRIAFLDQDLEQNGMPLQGQALLYFGGNVGKFAEVYSKFGVVLFAR